MKQLTLSRQLNYLNIEEIQKFCKTHKIPYAIFLERTDGKLVKSKDKDRKGVILNRIREYIKTGVIPKPTVYPSKVCADSRIVNPTAASKLHYGQYDKYNPKLILILKKLTDGKFRNGSIAREVMRDFWTSGRVPTLKEFANAWMKACLTDPKGHAEWAFLTDLSSGELSSDWKEKRNEIAKDALKKLSAIKPTRSQSSTKRKNHV